MEIAALAAFVGIVVCAVLMIAFYMKDGPWKIGIIGMGVCFVAVVVLSILSYRSLNDTVTADGEPVPTATEGQDADDSGAEETDGPGESVEPTEESESPAVDPTQEPKKDFFTVGDSVSLEDVTVTLVDVSESDGGNYMTPGDGKVFVLCEFRIENNSKNDIAVSSMLSFEAYVDDYATNMNLSATTSSDKQQLDGSVAAGKKMNGVIGYEVDDGWSSIEVRFTPDFWSGNEFLFVYSK